MKYTLLFLSLWAVLIFSVDAKSIRKKIMPHRDSPIQTLSMRHTACFGRCPDYIIQLNKNGLVTFTGLRFVKDSGVFTKQFPTNSVLDLFDRFMDSRVDTCKDNYENRIPDVSELIFTITYKDSVKKISNAQFAPLFLRILANGVDSFGHVDNTWKKITPANQHKNVKHAGK